MTRDPKVVRAAFDDEAVLVYQAYSPLIADEALRLGTFGPAFSPRSPARCLASGQPPDRQMVSG